MTFQELTTISNLVSGLPLHSVLFIAIIVLWRRVNVLQDKLDKCLAGV
jgi:hypothetical protein